MACLAAPPLTRSRASSTNVRPPLTLSTLGARRRSNSLLDLPPPTPSPLLSPCNSPHNSPLEPNASPRLVPLSIPSSKPDSLTSFISKVLQLFGHSPMHSVPSTPSSPRHSRASTDDTILPMSASPTRSTFVQSFPEKNVVTWVWPTSPSQYTPVLLVLVLFPLSTALVVSSMYTLPITTFWPGTLQDIAQLGRELSGFSQSGPASMAHVVAVISVLTMWNHAWSIPGSVLWNVLAGALFSPIYATLLFTLLTSVGSVFATLLAAPLAPFLEHLFPRALDFTRIALEGDSPGSSTKAKSSAWVRLSVLRLIGIVPWSGINITCGVCRVAIRECFLGSLIGSLPWTAVTCQIGDILQTVASNPSPSKQTVQSLLTSPEVLFKLAFLTILSLAPILGRNRLREWLSPAAALLDQEMSSAAEERVSRWVWIKEWQGRIRLPSRSRAQEAFRKELEVLTQEKNQSLPL
ncbi:snare associated Golgi protein-domain-containing protein [Sparassis latifolia]|uniref:VTT domain-containing protein n=1 Tax=Sparassis crispa TaxID=139825 RepID=A0A401GBZ1_9APHY|nr:predicted protein [Sparassis crispa]GBE79694.1 predicted protein [Sparassis crispa]